MANENIGWLIESVDQLAQLIRQVDGNKDKSAGEMAEDILKRCQKIKITRLGDDQELQELQLPPGSHSL